jgi:hypothetical protein
VEDVQAGFIQQPISKIAHHLVRNSQVSSSWYTHRFPDHLLTPRLSTRSVLIWYYTIFLFFIFLAAWHIIGCMNLFSSMLMHFLMTQFVEHLVDLPSQECGTILPTAAFLMNVRQGGGFCNVIPNVPFHRARRQLQDYLHIQCSTSSSVLRVLHLFCFV